MNKIPLVSFVDAITMVARDADFHRPGRSYWQCSDFSRAVVALASELGFDDAELWSTKMEYSRGVGEHSKGDRENHVYFKLGGKWYDYTARQFGRVRKGRLMSRFPVVMNTAYPDSKKVYFASLLDAGSKFWHEKIKSRLKFKNKVMAKYRIKADYKKP